jgi:hypothetical protein
MGKRSFILKSSWGRNLHPPAGEWLSVEVLTGVECEL